MIYRVCSIIAFLLVSSPLFAQKVTYAAVQPQDRRDINFEILGKVSEHYLVYKNVGWRHIIQVLDKDMNTLANNKLDFMPDRTFNVDFFTYPQHVFMVYQYYKNGVVYCKAVKIDGAGEKAGEIRTLDTTRISILNDSRIYGTAYSEDKKQLLIYKLQKKDGDLHIVTKRMTEDLALLDSVRNIVDFDERRDVYTPLEIANDGTVFFGLQHKTGLRENINNLKLITLIPGTTRFKYRDVPLKDQYIDEVDLHIDNMNHNYLANAFYYTKKVGSIEGVLSALLDPMHDTARVKFNRFPDTLRQRISNSGQYRFAFDNFFLKDVVIKRNGSFLLIAEDFYTQSRNNSSSNWNRWDYLYGSQYPYNSDFYMYNPRYGSYYRPYSQSIQSTRYVYDNILVAGLDSSLNMEWGNIIYKKQADDETDNFLSYITMNAGREIHFLFIEKERNSQVISDQAITPSGNIQRYATLKSREKGYDFMPRLGKQVALRQMIIPCIYHGNITFAKVDFDQ